MMTIPSPAKLGEGAAVMYDGFGMQRIKHDGS
jgi:hypothetical protein